MSLIRPEDSPLFALGVVMTCIATGILLVLLGGPRISIVMRGRVASAPADWSVLVYLRPETADRWMDVSTEGSTGFYRRIGFELDGARAPRVHQVRFKGLPTGCYDFRALVRARDQDGPVVASASSPRRLSVIGREVEGDPCA